MNVTATCIDIIGPARCTGCFGCKSACAQGAIDLALDADGFYKPIVEREKCNECGLCQRRCPVIVDEGAPTGPEAWPVPKAFAAWAKDEPTRWASSSGGIFSELARPVIDGGGAVVGCAWGASWTPEHVLGRTWSDVERMRGSKYVPSRVGDAYQQVLTELRERQGPVLFSGAPCQVAAMERALSSAQRQRVLLVEFICHGVPSLRVFHAYLAELFDGDAVASYTFRDKTLGWITVRAVSEHGRRHLVELSSDAFGRGFVVEHLYVMEACHDCLFARMPRGGDVTLGDFWGCPEEWHDRRGVSVILANSPNGLRAMESLVAAGKIELRATDVATAMARNPRLEGGSYAVPRNRRAFLDDLARGNSFAQVQRRFFRRGWRLLWDAFRESNSKGAFLGAFLRNRVGRIFRKGGGGPQAG